MTSTVLGRIEAAEKQIADIFSDKYAFTIPPYQRPYAWQLQQARELFDDLLDAMAPNGRSEGLYFLGSIVLVKTPAEPEAKVVDGQQRLTTLTILLSVLRDLTDDRELNIRRDAYVKQAANPDLGRPERLRLHLRQRDQVFFENTVQRRDATERCCMDRGGDGIRPDPCNNAPSMCGHFFSRSLSESDWPTGRRVRQYPADTSAASPAGPITGPRCCLSPLSVAQRSEALAVSCFCA